VSVVDHLDGKLHDVITNCMLHFSTLDDSSSHDAINYFLFSAYISFCCEADDIHVI